MQVWRLCKASFASEAFSGKGAAMTGGRWNHKGVRVVYTAEHLSLALLEQTVHFDMTSARFSHVATPAEIPEHLTCETITPADLPSGWRSYPALPELPEIGSRWCSAGRAVALRVPSAVVPVEYNVLLNPLHPDFARIVIGSAESFEIDHRLPP